MSLTTSGEVLTLQLGHYSNFIGTHWWNIQEKGFEYSPSGNRQDINHDVLFREGLNDKRQTTFTPRLLLVDLKGSLGALPEVSELYDNEINPSELQVSWSADKVEIKKEQEIPKNKFQKDLDKGESSEVVSEYNLEEDVVVWSDFLYSRLHPRTMNIIKEYDQNDSLFNTFPIGRELWKSEQFSEGFNDKIRNYVEECDYFQGCQVLFDAIDGFSGLSASCIENIKDEYARTTMALPTIPSFYLDYNFKTEKEHQQSIKRDSIRVLNLALTFNSLRENSSLFIPLCTSTKGWRQPGEKREFHHTIYKSELYYHSGAILASALDTFTLRYRLKGQHYTLTDLAVDITPYNRKAAAASVCLPFSLNQDSYLIECLDSWTGPLTKTLTPSCTLGSEHMVQLYTVRGILDSKLKKPVDKAGSQKDFPAYKCATIKEMMEFYLSCTTCTSINNVTVVANALTVKPPYPKIFDKFVGLNGNISLQQDCQTGTESIPVIAGLHNGSGIGEMLESLITETNKIKFEKFHEFKNAGLESDEFKECLEGLLEFKECYDDNYYI